MVNLAVYVISHWNIIDDIEINCLDFLCKSNGLDQDVYRISKQKKVVKVHEIKGPLGFKSK